MAMLNFYHQGYMGLNDSRARKAPSVNHKGTGMLMSGKQLTKCMQDYIKFHCDDDKLQEQGPGNIGLVRKDKSSKHHWQTWTHL